MTNKEMRAFTMKTKPFLIGLTAGIVGGTIAVLFSTPQSGQQLRSNLQANTDSAKEKIQDVKLQVSNVKHSVNNLRSEAKNNIPQIINDLKQSINTFSTEIEPTQNKLQQEIDALQNSISVIEKNIAQFTDRKNNTLEK